LAKEAADFVKQILLQEATKFPNVIVMPLWYQALGHHSRPHFTILVGVILSLFALPVMLGAIVDYTEKRLLSSEQ
jgi:hypothetical protein